jgi:Domain of unknown function (DUF4386)
MSLTKVPTWKIGILYLMMGLPAAFSLFYISSVFIVPGDATATARNITGAEFLFRLGILAMLVSQISFLFLGLSLYKLFENVDREQARLMVVLIAVGAAIELVNCLNLIAPLILLSGADFLSVFSKSQLDALALGSLRLNSGGHGIVTAFWSLWLVPFGILVIRSGYFPKILGVLLILAGVPYLVSSFTTIVMPTHNQVVSILMPLMLGELPMLFWLLFKGARVTRPEVQLTRLD